MAELSGAGEALTIALARRFAMVEMRNQQNAMLRTAQILRGETKDKELYETLTLFIGMTDKERQFTVSYIETDLLGGNV